LRDTHPGDTAAEHERMSTAGGTGYGHANLLLVESIGGGPRLGRACRAGVAPKAPGNVRIVAAGRPCQGSVLRGTVTGTGGAADHGGCSVRRLRCPCPRWVQARPGRLLRHRLPADRRPGLRGFDGGRPGAPRCASGPRDDRGRPVGRGGRPRQRTVLGPRHGQRDLPGHCNTAIGSRPKHYQVPIGSPCFFASVTADPPPRRIRTPQPAQAHARVDTGVSPVSTAT
jgi:hypothetical protein